ncbi:NeuD/PglB/VioB family sugar acetyltransferase [Georgenia subflava]|uniref:Acetyltransferase n=1 Tax=Georgenia subflava TaxID=1622177 RepID=A0A6N7ENY1_9MICO|nr:NeuD/PglB/VioB family sugar acetyltransferase [Georgenia subflava]MPV39171.1 acetyltransferase [Georgenia subflava]
MTVRRSRLAPREVPPGKRPILLIGANGMAREVLDAVRAAGSHEPVGFVDDDADRHGTWLDGVPVLGSLDHVRAYPDAGLVLCASRGGARASLAGRLAALGIAENRYLTVCHPSVQVPRGCLLGAGTVLLAHVALAGDVRVGRHVLVMANTVLHHGNVLEDFATLAAGVSVGAEVHVGSRAYLGMNASVRERTRVGADAVLGMGAAAVGDVPAGETWAGVPAQMLRSWVEPW